LLYAGGGGAGGAVGITDTDVEGFEVPALFLALTLNVYCVPFASPEIAADVLCVLTADDPPVIV
jgi:hypothetical protein